MGVGLARSMVSAFGDRYRGSEFGEPPPGCQLLERKPFAIGHRSGHHHHTAFCPSSLSPFFRRYSIHNSIQSGKDGTIA
ncbi:uncharacterized protein AKAW2_20553S [Aspergillus luchuensis]|uniref:Uncharacterized protein n=1 Tax=Aspergillus kawachii TaxID=1069201 RepID=A0A7R7ZUY4_ASPKA|nr:uncharacterized protein AKAW2_20553S [Aspergillus luchuensis]BCR95613.1 hypothetical protein AKAW2_20553S [Aspergillus luchuensis]